MHKHPMISLKELELGKNLLQSYVLDVYLMDVLDLEMTDNLIFRVSIINNYAVHTF